MAESLKPLDIFTENMFKILSERFPVSCASDEFFYFPQLISTDTDWGIWDNLCPEFIEAFVTEITEWESEVKGLSAGNADAKTQIDARLLNKMLISLKEQLGEVKAWESQPTLYLSLICIGMAEAMGIEDHSAKHARARGIPGFIKQAIGNLTNIPVLFRDLGIEMVKDTRTYLMSLMDEVPELKNALNVLERFEDHLKHVSNKEDFRITQDLLTRIISFHHNAELDIGEINKLLDDEIAQMKEILNVESEKLLSEQCKNGHSANSWQGAIDSIPIPQIGKTALTDIYREETNNLLRHCIEKGLISRKLISSCPLYVKPVPYYLKGIRTASAYSIQPRGKRIKGFFYVLNNLRDDARLLREYRMLTSHETFPGHHLLDANRWSNPKPCRRAIERPIFYEGWACFAEHLLNITGYFTRPGDRLLLARRRLWRAIRGKVDLGLQTGQMGISDAAVLLSETGLPKERALSSARRYTLNPGYQLCYTLGLRHFLQLFDKYGINNIRRFVREVMAQGEIGFSDMEQMLKPR